jgi:hypothetical protein
MENEQLDMFKVHYEWLLDIVRRIEIILSAETYTDAEKLIAIEWFIKQAGKVERED